MNSRPLGTTGLQVSEISLGAWALGGPSRLGEREIGWGPTDDEESLRVIRACLELGINLIDTADVYGMGHSEELIGKALEGSRDKMILVSKVGNRVTPEGQAIKDFSPAWIEEALQASLCRLQTDYLDVCLLHSPDRDFVYTEETFAPLEALRKKGLIRFYGVSVGKRSLDHAEILLRNRWGQVHQILYNLLERDAARLFPKALEAGAGILCRVPLASGLLTGKFTPETCFPENDWRQRDYPPERLREILPRIDRLRALVPRGTTLAQFALEFCLSEQAVSAVIAGAKTVAQLRENCAASDLLSPPASVFHGAVQALSG